jgi:hypothetical protein
MDPIFRAARKTEKAGTVARPTNRRKAMDTVKQTVKQIERAVMSLPDDEFQMLYDWIVELDHQKWDRQIAEDSEQGLLDELANQALAEHHKGRTTRL